MKKVIVFIFFFIGISFGFSLGEVLWRAISLDYDFLLNPYINAIIYSILFAGIGRIIAPWIERSLKYIIDKINQQTTMNLILGLAGITIGLVLGYLIALPFMNLKIPFISALLPFILPLILGIIGYQVATSRGEDWQKLFTRQAKDNVTSGEVLERKASDSFQKYKLLDTSVIIDGRVADIVKTHFLEGVLVIPNFVLEELQHIADSSDSLTRAKGRRGLDILNTLQKNQDVEIEFYEGDFEEIPEVDSKLIKLAKLIDGAIVTNDYNLNKVCEFQNITVFNINELANALKPTLIPGEEMMVTVIKAGTERQQGVAYLDDGTMIVVEDGQYYMNQNLRVVVTSALQTNAGRMIFARPVQTSERIESRLPKNENNT